MNTLAYPTRIHAPEALALLAGQAGVHFAQVELNFTLCLLTPKMDLYLFSTTNRTCLWTWSFPSSKSYMEIDSFSLNIYCPDSSIPKEASFLKKTVKIDKLGFHLSQCFFET